MSVQIQSEFFSDIDADKHFDANIGAMTYYTIGGNVDALVKPHSIESACCETVMVEFYNNSINTDVIY